MCGTAKSSPALLAQRGRAANADGRVHCKVTRKQQLLKSLFPYNPSIFIEQNIAYNELAVNMHKRVTIQRFGEKLRTLRERRELSIRELAEALGYPAAHNSYISEIETGKRMPKADFMLAVADLFGVTMDQLTRDELEV